MNSPWMETSFNSIMAVTHCVLARVRIHFEWTHGHWTMNNITYYSFLQLYMFIQKNLGQEVSDSLPMVVSYDFKKIKQGHAISWHHNMLSNNFQHIWCLTLIFNVENIPKWMRWTLNHLGQFWYCSFGCLYSKLRSCSARLKLSR